MSTRNVRQTKETLNWKVLTMRRCWGETEQKCCSILLEGCSCYDSIVLLIDGCPIVCTDDHFRFKVHELKESLDTKTVLLLWNSKFPAKICTQYAPSSERVTYNYRLYKITFWKSAVVRDPLREYLEGNLLFRNNNTVFVSAFLNFMNFSRTPFRPTLGQTSKARVITFRPLASIEVWGYWDCIVCERIDIGLVSLPNYTFLIQYHYNRYRRSKNVFFSSENILKSVISIRVINRLQSQI